MKFKFTIGRKIGTGFGILLFLTLIVFLLTKRTIDSSREVNYNIIKVYSPSVDALQELKIHIEKSKRLINNWVNIQSSADAIDKQKLNHLTEVDLPYSLKEIDRLSQRWAKEEMEIKGKLFLSIDTLFDLHAQVKELLSSWESYEDAEVQFMANDLIDPNSGQINAYTDKVIWQLDELILRQRNNTKDSSEEMIISFQQLEFVVIYLGIALGLGGILIAFFTVRSIVRPVRQLKKLLLLMGKGIIPEQRMKARTDEIGDMSEALNDLVDGFKRTTDFAREVGAGNFKSDYDPLSEQDTLGHALLKMRADLHVTEQILQKKVQERTEEIEKQKKEIEMLYTHVTDSIKYAKRIQQAILPSDDFVKKVIPNSFILFKPKDIVSGDFYWVEQKDGISLFAALDCTGHGVPGAFMTIVGYNTLNQI
ncbi:MAG: HAMP domain-containing protein, partial [Flavobacteriales bacterium]